jgi:hypothetical protein
MTQWVRHLVTSLLKSCDKIFSWSRFQRLSCPLAFFYIPDLVHALLQSNNDRSTMKNDRLSSLGLMHILTEILKWTCTKQIFDNFKKFLSIKVIKIVLDSMVTRTPLKIGVNSGAPEG